MLAGECHAFLEPLTRRKDDDDAFAVGADAQRSAAGARVTPHQQRRLEAAELDGQPVGYRDARAADAPWPSRHRRGRETQIVESAGERRGIAANSGTSGGRKMRQRARPVLRATISFSAAESG